MAEIVGRVCDVDGCDRPHLARGLCGTHYNQRHQPNRHRKVVARCSWCRKNCEKEPTRDKRYAALFCSLGCRDRWRKSRGLRDAQQAAIRVCPCGAAHLGPDDMCPKCAAPDFRSPLRRAIEDGDHAGVIAAIRADSDVDHSGCWIWLRQVRGGYPQVPVGGERRQAHRVALEARLGRPLGDQAAHHACANSRCVNPDHLQPVTAAENAAEMLARRYLVGRIQQLEAALAALDPGHPALAEVSVSAIPEAC